jgi:hypothetical protein
MTARLHAVEDGPADSPGLQLKVDAGALLGSTTSGAPA